MEQIEPIITGNFYHIYNRGINSCNLFESDEDYNHFLSLHAKYIDPVADTYAYVLMKNHFHLLVQIKDNIIYKLTNADRSKDPAGFEINKWETIQKPDSVTDLSALNEKNENINNLSTLNNKIPNPVKHISHLFNAYAKYYNKRYNRHGALFERSFKRKLIDTEEYLKQVIIYIHNNPIKHGFVTHPIDYPWSSYLDCISNKPSKSDRNKMIAWFDDAENFKQCHLSIDLNENIKKWLDE